MYSFGYGPELGKGQDEDEAPTNLSIVIGTGPYLALRYVVGNRVRVARIFRT